LLRLATDPLACVRSGLGVDSRAACLRKPDRNGLLDVPRPVLALANVVYLFANEFACLGRAALTCSSSSRGLTLSGLVRHGVQLAISPPYRERRFLMKFPAQAPEPLRCKSFVLLIGAYAGGKADGEPWLKPWLDWHAPIDNSFREMPFSEVRTIGKDPAQPTAMYCWSDMVDRLSDGAIDLLHESTRDPSSSISLHVLRHAGGAMARPSPNAGAVGNRDAQLYLFTGGSASTPQAASALQAEAQRDRATLAPHVRPGMWLNFMNGNGPSAQARIQEAFGPDTYQRLRALKARYDPNNTFRFSFQLGGQ
jgi:hypothetical protein